MIILDPSGRPAESHIVGVEQPIKLDVRVGTLLDIGSGNADGLPLVILRFRSLIAFLQMGQKRGLITGPSGRRPEEVMVVIPEPEIEALVEALTKPQAPSTEGA